MKRWNRRTFLASIAASLFLLTASGVSNASQIAGPPPAALQSAIRSFITLNANDAISWDDYSYVSLCPAGKTCLVSSDIYLVGYRIGDGAATAVAYAHNSQTCASCWTYTVLYAASGPMDVSTLQSVGVDPATAQALLAP